MEEWQAVNRFCNGTGCPEVSPNVRYAALTTMTPDLCQIRDENHEIFGKRQSSTLGNLVLSRPCWISRLKDFGGAGLGDLIFKTCGSFLEGAAVAEGIKHFSGREANGEYRMTDTVSLTDSANQYGTLFDSTFGRRRRTLSSNPPRYSPVLALHPTPMCPLKSLSVSSV